MPKTEKFLRTIKSENFHGPLPDKNTDFKPTDYQELITKLKEAITNNNQEEVKNLLKQKFIGEANKNDKNEIKEFEEVINDNLMKFVYSGINSKYIIRVKETHVYTEHNVSTTFLEKLLREHRDEFNSLYENASKECQQVLTDFSNLDLRDLDFKKIQLQEANLTNANLLGATNLTQKKLNRCISSENAQLPKGLIASWSNHKKEQIIAYIKELNDYGDALTKSSDKKGQEKGAEAVALAKELDFTIKNAYRFDSAFQANFLEKLEPYKESFKERRFHSLKMIVANIALCVLGCGLGYVAAGAVHYMKTGSFAFFNRPTSYDKYLQIAEAAEIKGLSK
ncbi:MAG TPA: pentapeptide repeat-containing protein [Legionella sp.]|nr:pentapeptide repeat-containing protein [Legionella sp.]